MSKLDLFIGLLLLYGTYRGYKNGFLMGLISLVAIVLGILGGFKLMGEGMLYLQREFNADTSVLPYLSFIIIFIIIVIGVNILGKVVKSAIDKTLLGVIDEALGAILGLIKWMFLLSVIFWITDSLDWSPEPGWTEGSVLYPITELFAQQVSTWISDFLPFFKETFREY